MDFLKGLFKGKKIKGIEITMGQGMPSELAEILSGGHAGKYEPLFIIKDHPQIEQLFKEASERRVFFEREAEALQDRVDASKNQLWKSVEKYMLDHGLWPKGEPHDADICLAQKNGVIMHHRHE